jgi:PAS domain S-box-containing protein
MAQDDGPAPEDWPAAAGASGAPLQASEQQFQRKFGGLPCGMIVISLDAGQPGRCLAVNDTFCQLTGYSREELVGTDLLGYVHPEDQPALDTVIEQITCGQTGQIRADLRLAGQDGGIIFARLTGSAIQPAAGGRYLAAFVEDVTAAEQARARLCELEAELAAARRQESLGQMVGGFAHDFNNLLTVIANYASLVHDEISVAEATQSKTKWEPVRWDMEQIEDATDRAKRLIQHVLAFARREETRPVLVDLGPLISDVTLLLGEMLGEQIPVAVEPGPGLWQVETDRGQLEQAIINIAVNARDAMPSGGQITIATGNINTADACVADPGASGPDTAEFAELLPGRYVALRITDTGPGMDRVIADRAFEPFFTTKTGDRAAGLGLSAVRRFAAQAGGKAWLRSEPGRGTTVTVLLPAAADSGATRADGTGDGRETTAGTVLVVDDDPAIREVIHRILSSAAYRVVTAGNGQEALSLLADPATPADLVLTDVVMPGMTAKAFAAGLQALRPGIRVLFMSGYERPDDLGDGWPDATTQVIGKPFSRAALLARIAQVLAAGTSVGTAEMASPSVPAQGPAGPGVGTGERAPQPVRVPRQ